jgi:hypothetical protein
MEFPGDTELRKQECVSHSNLISEAELSFGLVGFLNDFLCVGKSTLDVELAPMFGVLYSEFILKLNQSSEVMKRLYTTGDNMAEFSDFLAGKSILW